MEMLKIKTKHVNFITIMRSELFFMLDFYIRIYPDFETFTQTKINVNFPTSTHFCLKKYFQALMLKGVFAKNERGYRLNAIKKRI